jgi:hypothetical protein
MISVRKMVEEPDQSTPQGQAFIVQYLRAGYQVGIRQDPDHPVGGNFDMEVAVRQDRDGTVTVCWEHRDGLPLMAAREYADMIRRAAAAGRAAEAAYLDIAALWQPESAAAGPEPKPPALV